MTPSSPDAASASRAARLPADSGHPTFRLMRPAAVAALAAASLLAGCAGLPDLPALRPATDASRLGLTGLADPVDAQWWRALGDPQLDRLVDQALAGNPGLRIAAARLERAQAGITGAEANRLPQVNAAADATRQLYTRQGMIPPPVAGSVRNSGNLTLSTGWEIDFFGKHQAALQAALGQARAAQAEAEAARVLLAGNVVRAYLQLARLHAQEGVAERAIAQREQALGLVRARVQAGLDSDLELRQAEAALPEARGQREAVREQIEIARHALAVLAGQPAQDPVAQLPQLDALRPLPAPTQIPADLLGRRADIAAARWRAQAAGAEVDQARAQFYPNVNLTAFIGFSSLGLNRLVDDHSEQWGVGPAIRLPIFEAGRLRANLRGKAADREAAIASYDSALMDAVREVADQLTSIRAIDLQRAQQREAQAAAQAAYDLALKRYEAGLGNLLWVLNAESAVLAQRRQGVDLAARALDAQASLARALGGGWKEGAPSAAALPAASGNAAATASLPASAAR